MTKDEIVVRPAVTDDIPFVVGLTQESGQYHADIDSRLRHELVENANQLREDYLLDQLKEEKFFIGVAQKGDEIVGYITAMVSEGPPVLANREKGVIENLFVKSSVRRKGIGTRLYNLALEWLRKHSVIKTHLSVTSINKPAIAFWKQHGYSEIMLQFEIIH